MICVIFLPLQPAGHFVPRSNIVHLQTVEYGLIGLWDLFQIEKDSSTNERTVCWYNQLLQIRVLLWLLGRRHQQETHGVGVSKTNSDSCTA